MGSFNLHRAYVLSAFFMAVLLLALSGCSPKTEPAGEEKTPGYPIASEVFTTEQKTVLMTAVPSGSAVLFPYEIEKFAENGYGKWSYGEGLAAEKRFDLMPPDYDGSSAEPSASLLHFFTMTDIHIVDEETPAQAITFGYKGGNSSAYSPVILYSTQVLDAAVQTVNAINEEKPFDFGLFLGDAINNAQYNELRWYIDVLDGKVISPDSGIKDDPVPGPANDYQDEYQTAGLDPSIPWYQTLGNHDLLHMGAAPIDGYLREIYTGKEILNFGDIMNDPLFTDSRGFYMGTIDGSTPYGDITGAGRTEDFEEPPTVPAADADRRSLTRNEWMKEFFNTASMPAGHGFTQSNLDNDFSCYSFEPKSDVPLKVIVFDDTQNPQDFDVKEQSSIDRTRYEWLVSELDKGQAEGKLMIISAHMPIYMVDLRGNSEVSQQELTAKLHTYPNLLLWVSGHYHQNTVIPFKSPDAAHPELGFWQIETSSLRDFPQQFRTMEIVKNSDDTISILTTDVDPAVAEGTPAAASRSCAIAEEQIVKNKINYPPSGSYNAELVKQLSPEMQEKLKNIGTPVSE